MRVVTHSLPAEFSLLARGLGGASAPGRVRVTAVPIPRTTIPASPSRSKHCLGEERCRGSRGWWGEVQGAVRRGARGGEERCRRW